MSVKRFAEKAVFLLECVFDIRRLLWRIVWR